MNNEEWDDYLNTNWMKSASKTETAKYLLSGFKCMTCRWCFTFSGVVFGNQKCGMHSDILLSVLSYEMKSTCNAYERAG